VLLGGGVWQLLPLLGAHGGGALQVWLLVAAAISSEVEKGSAWQNGHRGARQHRRMMVRSSEGKGKGKCLGLGLTGGGGVAGGGVDWLRAGYCHGVVKTVGAKALPWWLRVTVALLGEDGGEGGLARWGRCSLVSHPILRKKSSAHHMYARINYSYI